VINVEVRNMTRVCDKCGIEDDL